MNMNFWKNASSKRKRILATIVILVITLAITIIGSFTPVNPHDAQITSDDLNQTVNSMKASKTLIPGIFENNFMICLIMFIPIAGPIFGFYVLFNTGLAISSVALVQGYPVYLYILSEFITPFFWLEFAAYSIAITESIWFIRRLLQRRSIRELRNAGILVAICAGFLILGAIIESAIISIA